MSTKMQTQLPALQHTPVAAQHRPWQSIGDDDALAAQRSVQPYEHATTAALPPSGATRLAQPPDVDAHFRHADRLYSHTYAQHSMVQQAGTQPKALQLQALQALQARGIAVRPEDQDRRAAYLRQCERPANAPALPEARMLLAIRQHFSRPSPRQLQEVRDILRTYKVTPALIEKQLEDFGHLAAPDWRTQLLDAEARRRVIGAIIDLRYGATTIPSGCALQINRRRHEALRLAGLLPSVQPGPQSTGKAALRVLGAAACAGAGMLASRQALATGLLTGHGALCTLLAAAMLALCAELVRRLDAPRRVEAARRAAAQPLSAQQRVLWQADRAVVGETLALELRGIEDGATVIWRQPQLAPA